MQVSNDNVLCKLKIRHHQTRGALLCGTKQHEDVEEEEKENEEVEKLPNIQLTSRIHKVSLYVLIVSTFSSSSNCVHATSN